MLCVIFSHVASMGLCFAEKDPCKCPEGFEKINLASYDNWTTILPENTSDVSIVFTESPISEGKPHYFNTESIPKEIIKLTLQAKENNISVYINTILSINLIEFRDINVHTENSTLEAVNLVLVNSYLSPNSTIICDSLSIDSHGIQTVSSINSKAVTLSNDVYDVDKKVFIKNAKTVQFLDISGDLNLLIYENELRLNNLTLEYDDFSALTNEFSFANKSLLFQIFNIASVGKSLIETLKINSHKQLTINVPISTGTFSTLPIILSNDGLNLISNDTICSFNIDSNSDELVNITALSAIELPSISASNVEMHLSNSFDGDLKISGHSSKVRWNLNGGKAKIPEILCKDSEFEVTGSLVLDPSEITIYNNASFSSLVSDRVTLYISNDVIPHLNLMSKGESTQFEIEFSSDFDSSAFSEKYDGKVIELVNIPKEITSVVFQENTVEVFEIGYCRFEVVKASHLQLKVTKIEEKRQSICIAESTEMCQSNEWFVSTQNDFDVALGKLPENAGFVQIRVLKQNEITLTTPIKCNLLIIGIGQQESSFKLNGDIVSQIPSLTVYNIKLNIDGEVTKLDQLIATSSIIPHQLIQKTEYAFIDEETLASFDDKLVLKNLNLKVGKQLRLDVNESSISAKFDEKIVEVDFENLNVTLADSSHLYVNGTGEQKVNFLGTGKVTVDVTSFRLFTLEFTNSHFSNITINTNTFIEFRRYFNTEPISVQFNRYGPVSSKIIVGQSFIQGTFGDGSSITFNTECRLPGFTGSLELGNVNFTDHSHMSTHSFSVTTLPNSIVDLPSNFNLIHVIMGKHSVLTTKGSTYFGRAFRVYSPFDYFHLPFLDFSHGIAGNRIILEMAASKADAEKCNMYGIHLEHPTEIVIGYFNIKSLEVTGRDDLDLMRQGGSFYIFEKEAPPSDVPHKSNTGMIVGITLGSVAFVAIIVVIVVVCFVKRKRNTDQSLVTLT